jgi:MFS transporter, PPP family, 3-phenylpropionic acid transporter
VKGIAKRLSAAQAASGMVSGIFTPFFGVWLAWRGLSAGEIAFVLSAGLILRLFAGPASGIFADARNDRRVVMLSFYWVMFAGYSLLAVLGSHWAVAAAGILATVASGVASPLLESVSVRLAEYYGYHYGRVRLWASSSFIVFNVVGGLCLWRFGAWTIAPLLGTTSALCVAASLRLPSPPSHQPQGNFAAAMRKTLNETGELLRAGPFLLFLIAAGLAQGSHAFYYGYGGLHWRALGYSGALIGILWPLGVFAEIALLMFAHRVAKVMSPARLLFWGSAGCLVRWALLAFDPPLAVVVIAQVLHGASFAVTHVGAMFFIARAVPNRLSATAQSLYFVCYSGLAQGCATYAAGLLYPSWGGRAYFLMSAMGLAAMVFSLILAQRWNGRRVVAGGEESIGTI